MPTQVHRCSQASKPANTYHLPPLTAKGFFHDSPWLKIPPHRMAEILIEPVFPRFRLLGGSSAGEGKMSKLAALAAKRRQKENEEEKASQSTNTANSVDDSASSLSKLRIALKQTSNSSKQRHLQPRQNLESKTGSEQTQELPSPKNTFTPPKQQWKDRRAEDTGQLEDVQSIREVMDLRAQPSLFARTLMDVHARASNILSEPSVSLPEPFLSSFDFSKPSPDDVVLKAQNFKGPR